MMIKLKKTFWEEGENARNKIYGQIAQKVHVILSWHHPVFMLSWASFVVFKRSQNNINIVEKAVNLVSCINSFFDNIL